MDEQNLFVPENNTVSEPEPSSPEPTDDSITWTASEFIDHSKSFSWYLFFFISILVIGYLVYIFTRSIFSSIVIFILGIALCYISTRKPKDINYGLDDEGIVINNTDYPFSVFKSYTLISEGGLEQIALISVKRFSPDKTIYFEPQDKDKIISLLGEFLPLETNTNDAIDKFMKKIGL